jgi:hypothetical protein
MANPMAGNVAAGHLLAPRTYGSPSLIGGTAGPEGMRLRWQLRPLLRPYGRGPVQKSHAPAP